nr:hypothetical protein [Tanacetum cinerariifolium]
MSIKAESLPPNHVFDFLANDPAPELEDPVMKVEEDLIEDLEDDLDMDINEDKEDESETPPLSIDPIMMSDYQITTSDFLPWIPPPHPSTYKVRGPSSAVLEAPYLVGCPLLVVASKVALHHRKIEALCVRADKIKNMQTHVLSLVTKVDGVSDAQVADNIDIAELQPRMAAVEEGVYTLAELGVIVASKLDETETRVLKMRHIVDNYPRGPVDSLRGNRSTAWEYRDYKPENVDIRDRLTGC